MIERNLIVDFNQGLDIRLIDEENAELIALKSIKNPHLKCLYFGVCPNSQKFS